jgi:hypothetical protein
MKLTIVTVLLAHMAAVPASAEGVRVPAECETLRQREGLPRVLTHDQVETQWRRLNQPSVNPLVISCRNAVARLRQRRAP